MRGKGKREEKWVREMAAKGRVGMSLSTGIFEPINFKETSVTRATIQSCVLATLYVGSLYINKSQLPRDHPTTIKQRFNGVLLVSLISPVLVFIWSNNADANSMGSSYTLTRWLGLHINNIVMATILPLLLTMILFFGPLTLLCFQSKDENHKEFDATLPVGIRITSTLKDLLFWRNYVVMATDGASLVSVSSTFHSDRQCGQKAPFTEEFVYRACMLPFLAPTFGARASVLLCPLFFGIAHVHHAVEGLRSGLSPFTVFVRSVFQMTYTTIFGAYSAFLFLRTGHLIGPVICHSFCNVMGFPEFRSIPDAQYPNAIASCFVIGLAAFIVLLFPLTDPSYFASIYWHKQFL